MSRRVSCDWDYDLPTEQSWTARLVILSLFVKINICVHDRLKQGYCGLIFVYAKDMMKNEG